jgi:hypothetical protein
MKNFNTPILFLVTLFAVACSGEKTPPIATSAEDSYKLIVGKTWNLSDMGIATSMGIVELKVMDEGAKYERPATVNWYGEAKDLSDFEKEIFEEDKQISLTLNADNTASSIGLNMEGEVTYEIVSETSDEGIYGIALNLSFEDEMFGNVSTMTSSYYVLGASETKLYLLSPRTINDKKVVLLLESK